MLKFQANFPDAAALHPNFNINYNDNHHYAHVSKIKKTLKEILSFEYSLNAFDLFLTSNTTHGLVSVVSFLFQMGYKINIAGKSQQHYPQYSLWLKYINNASEESEKSANFITHISPITGNKWPLEDANKAICVVDAAQSFATIHHNELITHADVFVAPCHKHMGLSPGVAVVGIRRCSTLKDLSIMMAMVDEGCSAIAPLNMALMHAKSKKKCFNTACFMNFDDFLIPSGVRLLTRNTDTSPAPFICFSYNKSITISNDIKFSKIQCKVFKENKIFRFSAYMPGNKSDPHCNFSKIANREIQDFFAFCVRSTRNAYISEKPNNKG